jgi:hypothetical protein
VLLRIFLCFGAGNEGAAYQKSESDWIIGFLIEGLLIQTQPG